MNNRKSWENFSATRPHIVQIWSQKTKIWSTTRSTSVSVHTHARTHARTHTPAHTYTHTYAHMCAHARASTHMCMHTRTCGHTHKQTIKTERETAVLTCKTGGLNNGSQCKEQKNLQIKKMKKKEQWKCLNNRQMCGLRIKNEQEHSDVSFC